MKRKYHIEITQKALENAFSQRALEMIIQANIRQDRIKYQIGHDHFHFDGSAFAEGFSYISEQTEQLFETVINGDIEMAWAFLGRILHSWQDFYSHSNYVYLWMQKTTNQSPEMIDYMDQEILNSDALKSGKNYGIIEFFAMIPILSKLIFPIMPEDSHAKMNLDSPKAGNAFIYAYNAAKKKTEEVVEEILKYLETQNINPDLVNVFTGKKNL